VSSGRETIPLAHVIAKREALKCRLFGEIAVEEGLLGAREIDECLQIQARQRKALIVADDKRIEQRIDRIGEILVRRGFIASADVHRVLALQQMYDTLDTYESDKLIGEVEEKDDGAGVERLTSKSAPNPTSEAGPSKNARRLGDYQLLKKLGHGAMGNVYLARQQSRDRLVALKILSPDMAQDKEYVERFRREAKAATRLNHPNIVKAHEVGVISGYHFIALEYVDGGDLETNLDQRPGNRYRSREVVKIAKDMAAALQAADRHGIVHRDIKPANVLVDSKGIHKLTDLGLAAKRKDDLRVTRTGHAVGTPFYISPEQAQGEMDVDIRTDIYSLGATLYHLATGKLPFNGENSVVVMTQHIAEPLTPPREVQPRIPKSLSRLIEKMMAKRPHDRHQSPEELLADIELLEAGGVPLLKRAQARLRPLESGLYGGSGSDLSQVTRGRRRSMPPTRKTLHPRHSRYPKGMRARSRARASWILNALLLLIGGLLGAAVAGMLFWGFFDKPQWEEDSGSGPPNGSQVGPPGIKKEAPPAKRKRPRAKKRPRWRND
jgi:serine/threonine-protein kinase